MRIQELTPGVYAVLADIGHPQGDSNFGLVMGENEAVLIDCDVRRRDDVELEIRKVTDVPIRYLVNTHDNYDHASGNVAFDPRDTVILASEACRHLLAGDRDGHKARLLETDAVRNAGGREVLDRRLLPDITVAGTLNLHVGGRVLELITVGHAHTPGDLVVYLPEEGILFAGDVLFESCHPVTRNADIGNWLQVLSDLKKRPIALTVPGHGRIRVEYENIESLGDYFQTLLSGVEELKEAGASLPEVQEKLSLADYDDWGKERWLPSTIEKVYQDV